MRCLCAIINKLQTRMENQDTIDTIYDEFLHILHNEMDPELEYKDYSCRTKPRHRKHKPYWNNELKRLLWLYAREAEKLYVRHDGDDMQRSCLKAEFINRRDGFDRELRPSERRYYASIRDNIRQLRTDNPKIFWKDVNKLGPGTAFSQQVGALGMSDGSVSSDPNDIILSQWKEDFKRLYYTQSTETDTAFLEAV